MSSMINCRFLVLYIALFVTHFSFGQNVNWQELKSKYPSEDYLFLSRIEKVEFVIEEGQIVIYEHRTDKKILLSEKAKHYEEMSIPYNSHSTLSNINAKSYVPKGKKYKSYSVKDIYDKQLISDHFFYDDSFVKTFVFPNVVIGTICEVSYTLRTTNPIFVPRVFLTSHVPILDLEILVEADERIDLSIYRHNYNEDIKSIDLKKNGDEVFRETYTNVAPLYGELDGPSIAAISPHLIINANSYIAENGERISYMSDVADLYREYYGFISSIDTIVNDDLNTIVDSIIINVKDEKEKVKELYQWVQSNIKYIAFEDDMGGFIPRDPQLVFDRRYGDCKDKTSLLVKMLHIAGIRAQYAWTGTRDLPYTYEETCGAMVDNHMIAMYYSENEKQYYYLDATDSYLPFGIPPRHLQEKQVLIENGIEDYDIIMTPVVDCTYNLNVESCVLKITDAILLGHVDSYMTGYEFGRYQEIFGNYTKAQTEKRYQTYFARGNNKSKISNIEVITKSDSIITSFDIEVSDYLTRTKNEIYINLNLERLVEDIKILNNKKYPLRFEQTFNYIRDYYLEIPNGFMVNYIPDNFEFDSEGYSCSISYSQKDGVIHYTLNLCQNSMSIEPDAFNKWSEFTSSLRRNYNENVILKKQ